MHKSSVILCSVLASILLVIHLLGLVTSITLGPLTVKVVESLGLRKPINLQHRSSVRHAEATGAKLLNVHTNNLQEQD